MRRASGIDWELLEHTLLGQHHVIARSQAMACGLTDAALSTAYGLAARGRK